MNAINQQCLKSPSLASSPTVPPTKPQRKAAVESPPVAHRWPMRPVVAFSARLAKADALVKCTHVPAPCWGATFPWDQAGTLQSVTVSSTHPCPPGH